MALKFREDKDLSVLALSSHKDLERLARILTHDESDDEKRRTQELLSDPSFKSASQKQDLTLAWTSIAAELQAYGGDTAVNFVRGLVKGHTGVLYREIVTDICDHLKLTIKPADDIMALEDQLLVELIRSQKEKFSNEELVRILKDAAKGVGLKESLDKDLNFEELIRRISGNAQTSYLAALVAPAIASAAVPYLARVTLPAVLAVVAPRMGGALVPGLNVFAAASLLTLASSPAFRVTLPAVLEVIRIRRAVLLAPLGEELAA